MIDADDFFAHVGGQLVAADELSCRLLAAGKDAGFEQRLGVRIEQRRGNRVVRERLARALDRGRVSEPAVLGES